MQLRIQKKRVDNILILSLWGQLDAMTADAFSDTVKSYANDLTKYVVLNFCNLEIVDSTGIGSMVSLLKRTRAEGGDMMVTEVSRQPLEVFRILSLDKSIKMFETVNEAVAHCRRQIESNSSPTLY